jgi:hypothetical protein
MPVDNSAAVDALFQRGKRGGNRPPSRRPGLPGPKTPPAEQPSAEKTAGSAEDKRVVPVDEQPVNPPAPPAVEVVDEPPAEEPPDTAAKVPEKTSPEPEPPVVPAVPIVGKPVPDQRKRKPKRPSAPPEPEHRVNWNPEARQIRAELLGWCAARAKAAKRAADVSRIVRKTYGDVPEDDLRAIVAEVAQRTGQPVEDVATVAGFAVD